MRHWQKFAYFFLLGNLLFNKFKTFLFDFYFIKICKVGAFKYAIHSQPDKLSPTTHLYLKTILCQGGCKLQTLKIYAKYFTEIKLVRSESFPNADSQNRKKSYIKIHICLFNQNYFKILILLKSSSRLRHKCQLTLVLYKQDYIHFNLQLIYIHLESPYFFYKLQNVLPWEKIEGTNKTCKSKCRQQKSEYKHLLLSSQKKRLKLGNEMINNLSATREHQL